MKRKSLKAFALTLSLVLVCGSLAPVMQVRAEAIPKEINLPIALRDISADNMLFQYDLGDDVGQHFTLTTQAFENGVTGATREMAYTDTYYMTGLVESALDPGTHALIYKQDTVELVAKMVYLQVMNPPARITPADRFNDLKTELAVADPAAINVIGITDDSTNRLTANYFFKPGISDEIGWDIGEPYTTSGTDVLIGGVPVWSHLYGIHHLTADTHTLTKNYTGLDAGASYTLSAQFENAGAVVKVIKGSDSSESTMTFDAATAVNGKDIQNMVITGETDITIEITATGDCFVNNLQLVNDGTSEVRNMVVFNTAPPAPAFTNSGWYPVDGTLVESGVALVDAAGNTCWKMDGDGLMNYGDSSSVYTYVTLNPGKEYIAMYDPMGGQDLTVNIYDESDNLISGNVESGYGFSAPAGTGKVKVVVTGTGDPAKTNWTQSKLVNLSFMQMPDSSILGDYASSAAKFADESKGWDDIDTCMDYAYFVLNNLYVTRTGLNTPYNDYTTITLKEIAGKPGHYGFYANVSDQGTRGNVVYDAASQNIKNAANGLATGLFPLDNASGYLTSPDYNKYMDEAGSSYHNFHYSMYSHANFVYESDKDLYFDFVGDDDVYLFIDGKLVMDIGGAHLAVHKTMELDDYAASMGLEDGKSYSFDFFYLERCTGYSNLAIETNIRLLEDGTADINLYNGAGTELNSGAAVAKDSVVDVEYEFRANVNEVKSLDFHDTGLGVRIGTSGLDLGTEVELPDGEITVTVEKADGTVLTNRFSTAADVQAYFAGLVLEKDTVVKISGLTYKMDANLNAALAVTYTSKDYAGAIHAETEKVTKANATLTLPVPGTTAGSGSGSAQEEVTTPGTEEGTGNKVPKTGDTSPIGLCVVMLLAGAGLWGVGTFGKRR